MKEQRKTWDSFEIQNCSPDSYGQYDNWENIFFDAVEYEKRKIEETKQAEEENKKTAPKISKKTNDYDNPEIIKIICGNPNIKPSELTAKVGKGYEYRRRLIKDILALYSNTKKESYNNTVL
jgi:hypothetical protein